MHQNSESGISTECFCFQTGFINLLQIYDYQSLGTLNCKETVQTESFGPLGSMDLVTPLLSGSREDAKHINTRDFFSHTPQQRPLHSQRQARSALHIYLSSAHFHRPTSTAKNGRPFHCQPIRHRCLDMTLAEPYPAFNACVGKLFCCANMELPPLPADNIPDAKRYTGGHVPPLLQSFPNSIKDGKTIIPPPTNASIIRDKFANSQRMIRLVSAGPGKIWSYLIPNLSSVGWIEICRGKDGFEEWFTELVFHFAETLMEMDFQCSHGQHRRGCIAKKSDVEISRAHKRLGC